MRNNELRVVRLNLFCMIASSLVLIAGCRSKGNDGDEEGRPAAKALVTVKVDAVRERDAAETVSALGRTDVLRKEKLYSPIAGKIITMKVYEGTEVKRGDVVAVIQSKESNAAIMGAEAMAQSADTPEAKAEAERQLHLARSTQNSINVISKFDGVISARSVSEGELVAENGELMTIIDLSSIVFLADVPVRDLFSVKPGQQASIRFQSFPGREFPAIVDAINPQTDMQSQTVKTRLRLLPSRRAEASLMRTDIVGTASIVTGIRHHSFFVPKPALLRDDENNSFSIVTLTADSLSVTIPVSVRASTDSSVEIAGTGLREGMPVITEGNYSLADSTRVTLARQD